MLSFNPLKNLVILNILSPFHRWRAEAPKGKIIASDFQRECRTHYIILGASAKWNITVPCSSVIKNFKMVTTEHETKLRPLLSMGAGHMPIKSALGLRDWVRTAGGMFQHPQLPLLPPGHSRPLPTACSLQNGEGSSEARQWLKASTEPGHRLQPLVADHISSIQLWFSPIIILF